MQSNLLCSLLYKYQNGRFNRLSFVLSLSLTHTHTLSKNAISFYALSLSLTHTHSLAKNAICFYALSLSLSLSLRVVCSCSYAPSITTVQTGPSSTTSVSKRASIRAPQLNSGPTLASETATQTSSLASLSRALRATTNSTALCTALRKTVMIWATTCVHRLLERSNVCPDTRTLLGTARIVSLQMAAVSPYHIEHT